MKEEQRRRVFPISPEMELRRHTIEESRKRAVKALTADELDRLQGVMEDGLAVKALTSLPGWAIIEEIFYSEMNFNKLSRSTGDALRDAVQHFASVRAVVDRIYDVIAEGEKAVEMLEREARQKEERDGRRTEQGPAAESESK